MTDLVQKIADAMEVALGDDGHCVVYKNAAVKEAIRHALADAGGAVARIERNMSGQIRLCTPDGDAFDMSAHVGVTLYTHPAHVAQSGEAVCYGCSVGMRLCDDGLHRDPLGQVFPHTAAVVHTHPAPSADRVAELELEIVALTCNQDGLLDALEGLLSVVSVRIDDPRIKQFDAARHAVEIVKGGMK